MSYFKILLELKFEYWIQVKYGIRERENNRLYGFYISM